MANNTLNEDEEPRVYMLEPRETFDRFILGLCETQTGEHLTVYDKDAVLKQLINEIEEGGEYVEDEAHIAAVEHFYNDLLRCSPLIIFSSRDDLTLTLESLEDELKS